MHARSQLFTSLRPIMNDYKIWLMVWVLRILLFIKLCVVFAAFFFVRNYKHIKENGFNDIFFCWQTWWRASVTLYRELMR